MNTDDEVKETRSIKQDSPRMDLLRDAVGNSTTIWAPSKSITADDVRAAIEKVRNDVSYPSPPPVHPLDYQRAREVLGLPKDHRLTWAEYWEGYIKYYYGCED